MYQMLIYFSSIQALCSGLKFAITNLLDDFQPMLPDLCNLIVAILQSKCVAPAVDIAKSVNGSARHSIQLCVLIILLF